MGEGADGTEMKTELVESITSEEIRAFFHQIRNYSRRNLSAVEVVLLDHAEQMMVYAGIKSEAGELDEKIAAHYEAGRFLAKLVAGIK